MAKMVLKAQFTSLNGVDRSSNCFKCELTTEVEERDISVYTSLGWTEVEGGMAKGSLAPSFRNDHAAAALDESMWALFGTKIPFVVRHTNAAVSTSNPNYTGTVLVKTWTPIGGGLGDVNEASHTWPTSGAVLRATS